MYKHSLLNWFNWFVSNVFYAVMCRMKNYLSDKVHLMCYRICVRALTAIITYHDRYWHTNTSIFQYYTLLELSCYFMTTATHLVFTFTHFLLSTLLFFPSSENKPKNGGICVANHTSPIDVIILASDGCYAMVVWCLCLWLWFSINI